MWRLSTGLAVQYICERSTEGPRPLDRVYIRIPQEFGFFISVRPPQQLGPSRYGSLLLLLLISSSYAAAGSAEHEEENQRMDCFS